MHVVFLSNYSVAIFHLANHTFFKILLFLGAGSVIHAVGDQQDMIKTGGLHRLHPPVRGKNVKTFRWDHSRLQIQNLLFPFRFVFFAFFAEAAALDSIVLRSSICMRPPPLRQPHAATTEQGRLRPCSFLFLPFLCFFKHVAFPRVFLYKYYRFPLINSVRRVRVCFFFLMASNNVLFVELSQDARKRCYFFTYPVYANILHFFLHITLRYVDIYTFKYFFVHVHYKTSIRPNTSN